MRARSWVRLWLMSAWLTSTWLVSAPATAQDRLADARAAYFDVDLARARTLLGDLVADPSATRAELAECHAWLGAIEAMLGDDDVAARHVDTAVWLEPGVQPPEGAPPQVDALFERARAAHGETRVELGLELPPQLEVGHVTEVLARVTGAPELMSTVSLSCGVGEERWSSEGPGPLALEVLPSGPGTLECEAIGRVSSGAIVVRARAGRPVISSAAATVVLEPDPSERHVPPLELPPRDPGNDELAIGLGVGAAILLLATGSVVIGVLLSPSTTSEIGVIRVVGF